jgi:hypothetical protein
VLEGLSGLSVVEAETATSTDGSVVTPESSWTEESSWSGSFLSLTAGQSATFDLGAAAGGARIVEPVIWQVERGTAETPRSLWRSGALPLGVLDSAVGEQGITAASGALLPQRLTVPVPSSRSQVQVRALAGTVQIDALLVRPQVATLAASGTTATGAPASAQLAQNALRVPSRAMLGAAGLAQTVRSYDASGVLVHEKSATGPVTLWLPAGGYAIAISD